MSIDTAKMWSYWNQLNLTIANKLAWLRAVHTYSWNIEKNSVYEHLSLIEQENHDKDYKYPTLICWVFNGIVWCLKAGNVENMYNIKIFKLMKKPWLIGTLNFVLFGVQIPLGCELLYTSKRTWFSMTGQIMFLKSYCEVVFIQVQNGSVSVSIAVYLLAIFI